MCVFGCCTTYFSNSKKGPDPILNCTPIVRHHLTIGGAVFLSKFSPEEKLKAVQSYFTGNESFRRIAARIGTEHKTIRKWLALYRAHGMEGLIVRYTNNSVEFKMDVLRFMNETGTSLLDTAARYNIPAPSTISQWKRVLEERGIDALQPMKKGRPSMKKEDKQLVPEGSKEALQAEVERLRMENAYLKKLNALVQSKEKLRNKTKHK
jgi:transposase